MERFFLMAKLKLLSENYALCITRSVRGRMLQRPKSVWWSHAYPWQQHAPVILPNVSQL